MNAKTKTFPSREEADRLAKESMLRQMSGNPDESLASRRSEPNLFHSIPSDRKTALEDRVQDVLTKLGELEAELRKLRSDFPALEGPTLGFHALGAQAFGLVSKIDEQLLDWPVAEVVVHEGITDSNLPALQRAHQAAFTAERAAVELNGRLSGPKGKIRRRDDLSFTRRDDQDRLINWYVDPAQRARYWENGKAIGKAWFGEVRKLAKHNPAGAFDALRFGCCDMSGSGGEEAGFIEAFAQAAIAGILAHPEGIPEITT